MNRKLYVISGFKVLIVVIIMQREHEHEGPLVLLGAALESHHNHRYIRGARTLRAHAPRASKWAQMRSTWPQP